MEKEKKQKKQREAEHARKAAAREETRKEAFAAFLKRAKKQDKARRVAAVKKAREKGKTKKFLRKGDGLLHCTKRLCEYGFFNFCMLQSSLIFDLVTEKSASITPSPKLKIKFNLNLPACIQIALQY